MLGWTAPTGGGCYLTPRMDRAKRGRGRVDAVMAEHFEPAMEAFGLTFEEIDEALSGGWAITLWGCAFEDFLTRRVGPDGENSVEAYLRRRGWEERGATRDYMTALQAVPWRGRAVAAGDVVWRRSTRRAA